MRMPTKKLKVCVVQCAAGREEEENLAALAVAVRRLPRCDLAALPEVFSIRTDDKGYRAAAEPLADNRAVHYLRSLAVERRMWVLGGSVLEKAGRSVYNTSVLINRTGRMVASYRKIHLFEARLEDGTVVRERAAYKAGAQPVLATVEGWRCGLSICYDLRFPELYRGYAAGGAHVLFVPSNFTQRTGRDHWATLVCARAIENQCYVVAPNQCGVNPATQVESYGNSMVAGPWGEVLCRASDRPVALSATLDPRHLREVRARVPALKHRRLG